MIKFCDPSEYKRDTNKWKGIVRFLARSLSKDKMSVLPYKSQLYFFVLKHTSPKGNEGIMSSSIPKESKLPRKEFN